MIAFTRAHTYFKQMNTELLGLSVDSNSSHERQEKLPTKKQDKQFVEYLKRNNKQ